MLTLLTALAGGFIRLLPEIMGWFNKKTDNTHELALMDKQMELEKLKSANQIQEVQVQGEISESIALIEAQREALKAQMQKTGIKVVDFLNFLVRPYIAYTSITFYYLAKIAMFVLAYKSDQLVWDSILKIYTPQDFDLLVGIINFYLVGRVIDKSKK